MQTPKTQSMASTQRTRRAQRSQRPQRPQGPQPRQCSSCVVQTVEAPLPLVWSIVRQFSRPQAYKPFIRSCTLRDGDGGVGSVRDVVLVSGVPARSSTERLDRLDDESHEMAISVIGGEHRLKNYRSTTTVREEGRDKTVVAESYVVDVPDDSNQEDTRFFTDTVVKYNLRSLAGVAEGRAKRN